MFKRATISTSIFQKTTAFFQNWLFSTILEFFSTAIFQDDIFQYWHFLLPEFFSSGILVLAIAVLAFFGTPAKNIQDAIQNIMLRLWIALKFLLLLICSNFGLPHIISNKYKITKVNIYASLILERAEYLKVMNN